MKRMMALILALVMLFALTACGGNSAPAEEKSDAEEPAPAEEVAEEPAAEEAAEGDDDTIVIGCCVMDMANEVFVQYVEGYDQFCAATGNKVETVVVDGASQPEKQVEALENFITLGVDAIMLNAVDLSAVEDVIARAMEAGIKVGVYPSMEDVTMNFVFDEYNWGFDLGVEAGNWINDKLGGTATIACFNQAELEEALGRYNGYIDGVLSVCDENDVTFLEPISTVEPVSAMEGMENLLQAHPEIKVVLASADAAAVGAYQAIVASGVDTSDMFLGGCDGISEALQYISEGSVFRATCANLKSTSEMGFDLLQNLTKAVLGMDYDAEYFAPTGIVNADNIEEYMAQEPNYQLDPALVDALG